MDALHGEYSQLEQLLSREEVYRDGERVRQTKKELNKMTSQREQLMKRWEAVDKQRREHLNVE